MEMAAGGSLTSYVADKWQKAQALGLFLSEDEARFFFKVRAVVLRCAVLGALGRSCWGCSCPRTRRTSSSRCGARWECMKQRLQQENKGRRLFS